MQFLFILKILYFKGKHTNDINQLLPGNQEFTSFLQGICECFNLHNIQYTHFIDWITTQWNCVLFYQCLVFFNKTEPTTLGFYISIDSDFVCNGHNACLSSYKSQDVPTWFFYFKNTIHLSFFFNLGDVINITCLRSLWYSCVQNFIILCHTGFFIIDYPWFHHWLPLISPYY